MSGVPKYPLCLATDRREILLREKREEKKKTPTRHVFRSQTRMPTQGQIQAQAGQTAQVTLTKPPVVSVPAVVSSAGVTTLPVTVAGISVAIGQAQKTGALTRMPLGAFFFVYLQINLKKKKIMMGESVNVKQKIQM